MKLLASLFVLVFHCMAQAQPFQWPASSGGNGHWYEVVPLTNISWESADLAARARGGHLVAISNAAENAVVTARILQTPGCLTQLASGRWLGPWMGGIQTLGAPEPAGGWTWGTGEPWGYTNWDVGQPDNNGTFGQERYAQFSTRGSSFTGTWNDRSLDDPNRDPGYVIEWDADCNGDGLVDFGQIRAGVLLDSDSDGIPDICETCMISPQPSDQPAVLGGTAVFSVGSPSPITSFQWKRGSTLLVSDGRITGATTPTLTINNVGFADRDSYSCMISGPCGTATSDFAVLTCSPVIQGQPSGRVLLSAGTTLSVSVAGQAPNTFRWRQDGQNLFNVAGLLSGVTTNTLQLLSDDPSLQGNFDVVITNACGTTTSTPISVARCFADVNEDGNNDQDDVLYLISVIAGSPDPVGIDTDFNRDGNSDQDDVSALISVVAGAGCP